MCYKVVPLYIEEQLKLTEDIMENKNEVTDGFEVQEIEPVSGRPSKCVFLLPNLITTGALFAGFYAIVSAVNGEFVFAAMAILAAGILDGIDGSVARLTNTQSKFGAEYDSLSDSVAFGVAPGLIAYVWALSDLGNLGWAAAFLYVACAALRLARFNVEAEVADHRFFTGLASPAAAGLVATFVWLGASRGWGGEQFEYVMVLVLAVAGLLMVSPVRYHSFKEFRVGRVPFRVLLGAIVALAVVFLDPPLVLLVVAVCYALSGPLLTLGFFPFTKKNRKSVQ